MKTKLLSTAAAVLLVASFNGPALAADCDSSDPGKNPPGAYISGAAQASGGLANFQPFRDAVDGVAGTELATGVNGTADSIETDDQLGAGGDMQALLGIACGVGSRRGEHNVAP